MNEIAVRTYTTKKEIKPKIYFNKTHDKKDFSRVLVFDCETSIDEFQNMKSSYFDVKVKDVYCYGGLFYNPNNISKKEKKILEDYSKKNNIRLFTLEEFVKIFFWEAYENQTLVLGYNLMFDLSRLMIKCAPGRNSGKGGFSLLISEDKSYPRLRIKQLNDKAYSMSFAKGNQKYNRSSGFKGNFCDVQVAVGVLTDTDRMSLDGACKHFNTEIQKKVQKQHGIVTAEYISYNIADVKATYQVYQKVRQEFELYGLDLPITDVYSAASLGKCLLKQCGIKSFRECNPNFPPKIIGKLMGSYYGGRCEAKICKQPVRVSVLDFKSMYPTTTLLLGLWDYLIAEKLVFSDVSEEAQKYINDFSIQKALNPDEWKKMNILVELFPKEDILPIRCKYGEKDDEAYTIGVNYLTSDKPMCYMMPDILASKILTGKPAKILKAYRFEAVGKQDTLKKTSVYGVEFDPSKDNLVKMLVEKREGIKARMKKLDEKSPEYKQLDGKQRALKILNNATTYGLNIELVPEDEDSEITAYSSTSFDTIGRYEKPGIFYNPLIGSMITSGTKLLLAIAEKYIIDKGGSHSYMDTDSVFCPFEMADEVSKLFNTLNPYSFNKPLLAPEEGMQNIYAYIISSKRYCLYHKEGNKIIIPQGVKRFHKLHGLGHILNPFRTELKEHDEWHIKIWQDVLKVYYDNKQLEPVLQEYRNYAVISRSTITTLRVLNRFRTLNKDKPLNLQLKPFNFFLAGFATSAEKIGRKTILIKPLAPFTKNPQECMYKPFINYYTGKEYCGMHYWKKLSEVFSEYISHPESKFLGKFGKLERRHISPRSCKFIGKEVNDLENEEIEIEEPNEFLNKNEIENKILLLKTIHAKVLGISKGNLSKIQKKIRVGRHLNFKTSDVKKIEKNIHLIEP